VPRLALSVLGILLAVVAVPACGPKPCPGAARAGPPGPPLLWRVQRAGGDGPVVWLYGTLHSAGERDVAPAAWDALDRSPRLVTELGELEPDRDALRAVTWLARGKGLDHQLPIDAWWNLRDALRGVIGEDDLKRARPWYAMSLLTRTMSPPPNPTMDVAITRRGRARGMPIDPLETWHDQLSQLDASVGIADLVEAIRVRRAIRCDLAASRAAYAAGDLAEMERVFGVDRTGLLLRGRNQRWLPAIEGYLADGGAFVAVGIGHLVGADGLPAMLERAGYAVDRMAAR
jgi:uncharacterized protein